MKYQLASTGLTANDIASIWRIPKGTVYRYAHMHRWRRYKQIGRVYYHPDDVTATLEEMQPE